ncbi:hypothetical protein [Embleya sp. NPDC059237]|uniref:hypothetical protein n=1 Tax=Embleya sp. NPDC059237 TaxID=3346784 RepID=UPI0036AC7367
MESGIARIDTPETWDAGLSGLLVEWDDGTDGGDIDLDGNGAGIDPEREERRRVRHRYRIRLRVALLRRSWRGRTSKIRLVSDRNCRSLAWIPSAGLAADSPRFVPVPGKVRVGGPVGRPRTRPDAVAGDRAHSSRGNRVRAPR